MSIVAGGVAHAVPGEYLVKVKNQSVLERIIDTQQTGISFLSQRIPVLQAMPLPTEHTF